MLRGYYWAKILAITLSDPCHYFACDKNKMLRCECETLLLLPEENDSIFLLRSTKRIWWWPKQYFNSTSTFVSSLKKAGSAWEKYTRIRPSPYLGPDKYIKCKRVYWIYFWGVLNQEWYISYREQDRLLSISFPKQRFRQVGENWGVSSKKQLWQTLSFLFYLLS